MVKNWLKTRQNKRGRIPHIDAPPVVVTHSSSDILPPCSFADISIFQNSGYRYSNINHFASSHCGNAIHMAFLMPALTDKNGPFIKKMAQECWLQQNVDHPGWLGTEDPLKHWLVKLQSTLADFGGGTLSASFQGISLDCKTQTALIYLSGLASVTTVTTDEQMRQLTPSSRTGLVGDLKANLPEAYPISTKNLATLVLASDDYQHEKVAQGVDKIKRLPYPKSGAAELLFFELQKKGNGSSVLWIDF